MESRAVPVAQNRFAMQLHVDSIGFAKPSQQKAGDPNLIRSGLRTLTEYLVFPLAFSYFGVDAFVIDSGSDTQVEMRITISRAMLPTFL